MAPWGCQSIWAVTLVRPWSTGSNVTTPDNPLPASAVHATRSSGCCSVIRAYHSARLPPTSATQCRRSSVTCSTCCTPSMNRGNSSNCVHWLYAVVIGTPTSMASVTFAIAHLPPQARLSTVYPAVRAANPSWFVRRLPWAAYSADVADRLGRGPPRGGRPGGGGGPSTDRRSPRGSGRAGGVLRGGLVREGPDRPYRQLARRGRRRPRADPVRDLSARRDRHRAMNKTFFDLMHDVAYRDVQAQAVAARTRMLSAWRSLPEPSSEANRWISKAGPDHYAEHLPRLKEWVAQLDG